MSVYDFPTSSRPTAMKTTNQKAQMNENKTTFFFRLFAFDEIGCLSGKKFSMDEAQGG